jgi:hypothetical protein
VLHGNDAGSWTRAAPVLYPHQWSWDSAFIAIGWAHLDVRRAMTELEQLFAAQLGELPSGLVGTKDRCRHRCRRISALRTLRQRW